MIEGSFVGYLRVSTHKQSFIWQKDVIERFARENKVKILSFYEEVISGTTLARERPVFRSCCDFCDKNGYSIIVASIDRLFRNVDFPVDFSRSDFRKDFDVLVIEPRVKKGYASIEEIGFSILLHKDIIQNML